MAAIGENTGTLVAATERREVSWLRQPWLVDHKDLRVEIATGEIVTTSGFFGLLIVVIGSLSFYAGPNAAVDVAPGVIWVAVAFASVLALSRTWQRERENDALSGLLVGPVKRSAIFAGKAAGVSTFIFAIQLLVLLGTSVFFSIPLGERGVGLLVLSLAANPGIAAAGTLFGAMTVRTAARDLILASVLFPLLAPTLLAGVAGTRELLDGVPLHLLTDYLQLMAVFALVFVAGGLSLFGALIES
ncbi:MAG: heme exporter protein CcmB [Polyangiaceae bacterium]